MAGLVSSPPFRSMVTVGTEVQLCLLGRLMFVCSVDLASGYEKKKKRSEIITSSLEKSDQATLRLFCAYLQRCPHLDQSPTRTRMEEAVWSHSEKRRKVFTIAVFDYSLGTKAERMNVMSIS
jgi:hypothetical protein